MSISKPVGVLLAALGTPDAPTARALRPYLAEFLSDPRVVDYNPILWQMILRLVILPRRPARSAALYRRIWTPDGSPLLVHSQAQAAGLQERLGNGYRVVLGMRYGQPSIAQAMQTFADDGIDRILVFPAFPQFSSSTTGSIYDAVACAGNGRRCPVFFEHKRRMPTQRTVPPYYDHSGYIDALKQTIQAAVQQQGEPDHYLFSFHGILQRYVDEDDPYREQSVVTAQRLAAALNLRPEQWTLSFQSQFGREPWLQPYTSETLTMLGRQGVRSLLVACPGFTADCLETLDEIGNEGAHQFRQGGGERLQLVPCLNAHPAWLDGMAEIVRNETQGWR